MTVVRRLWRAPLWAHAVLFTMALLALLPLMRPQSTFTQDEGAYALQARALAQGSWEYRYQAADLDPEGRWFPVLMSTRNGDRFYTYIQHPAYPLLLHGAASVLGTSLGLHLLAMLGAVGAASAAWLLAAEVNPSLSRPAFWVAATSPVLVNGLLLWAHAPSAAAAGFALLAASRVARRGLTPLATMGAVAALVAGVLLRSEGLLFAGAVAGAVAAHRFRRSPWMAAVTLAVLAGPAVAVALAERAWIRSIAGDGFENLTVRQDASGAGSYVSGRLAGAFHTLVQAHMEEPAASLPVLAGVGLAVGLGYLALRRWRPTSPRDLALALIGVSLFYALRLVLHPRESVTGLFAAWPLAGLGLLLLPGRDQHPVVRLCLRTAALFAAGVLLTQYAEGGGLEWGGRFFSPATVPLTVVVTVAIAYRLGRVPEAARRGATTAIAGVAALGAVFALVTVGARRAHEDGQIAAATRHPATVSVVTVDVFPRIAWRTHDRLNWMVTDRGGLPELLGALRAAGVGDVTLLTSQDIPASSVTSYPEVRRVAEPALEREGAVVLLLR